MTSSPTPLPITYWHGTKYIWQENKGHTQTPPSIGSGVILGDDNPNWRVKDAWLSYDKHGQLDAGWHVFLEPAETADDLPLKLWPDYFGDNAS